MKRWLPAVLLTLAACATTPVLGVADADDSMVANCRFLGEVHGASGWGGAVAASGMENAKNAARRQAQALGATHVVWASVAGGYGPSASGRAYACR